MHNLRFPNEAAEYRSARDELLKAEMELRDRIEEVAALRRRLPLGGEVQQDYVFEGSSGPVRLSELFQPGKGSLIIYSFMYGPNMNSACPMCTSFLDGINGIVPHAVQRVNLVVVAKSPIDRILSHAKARGWSGLRLLSSHGNTYNRDYHGGRVGEPMAVHERVRPAAGKGIPFVLHRDVLRAARARQASASCRLDVAALEPARFDPGGPGNRLAA